MTQPRIRPTSDTVSRQHVVTRFLEDAGAGDCEAFDAVASRAMRQVLLDYAKRRHTAVSPATVKRRWSLAQAWLYRDLSRSCGSAV